MRERKNFARSHRAIPALRFSYYVFARTTSHASVEASFTEPLKSRDPSANSSTIGRFCAFSKRCSDVQPCPTIRTAPPLLAGRMRRIWPCVKHFAATAAPLSKKIIVSNALNLCRPNFESRAEVLRPKVGVLVAE